MLATCIPLVLFPGTGATLLPQLYDWVANNFGPFYLLAGSVTIIFLLWLALGRFGKVRIGGDDTAGRVHPD